jgi:hypothetical protein
MRRMTLGPACAAASSCRVGFFTGPPCPRYYKSFTRLRRERYRERMVRPADRCRCWMVPMPLHSDRTRLCAQEDERDRTREVEEAAEAQRKAEEAAAAAKERGKAGLWARGSVSSFRIAEDGDAAGTEGMPWQRYLRVHTHTRLCGWLCESLSGPVPCRSGAGH